MFDLVQGRDQHADAFNYFVSDDCAALHLSITASWRIPKIPKFPLQKGRAEVAALTTGTKEML
jgi:hypothetical protein